MRYKGWWGRGGGRAQKLLKFTGLLNRSLTFAGLPNGSINLLDTWIGHARLGQVN